MSTSTTTTLFNPVKQALLAGLYFLLATIITWYFIEGGSFIYQNDDALMLLSMSIAGGKWTLQILVAYLKLAGEQKWIFIKRLGLVSLIGSLVLLPYALFGPMLAFQVVAGRPGFYGLLIASVLSMIPLYYRAVRKSNLGVMWFWSWMVCLAIAITLQVTVVFHLV